MIGSKNTKKTSNSTKRCSSWRSNSTILL